MFTGIIEEVGKVSGIITGTKSSQITVQANLISEDLKTGDSVNTNGVCLTVSAISGNTFSVDVMPETMRTTGIGALKQGSGVNLERAMMPDTRFGGHIVSGHIDGTGKILRRWTEANALWFTVSAPADIMKYIIRKGSVALDGISLTVADCDTQSFSVSVIPHTRMVTTLPLKGPGDTVNIECDMIGKYVEKFLKPDRNDGLTLGKLSENGFI